MGAHDHQQIENSGHHLIIPMSNDHPAVRPVAYERICECYEELSSTTERVATVNGFLVVGFFK